LSLGPDGGPNIQLQNWNSLLTPLPRLPAGKNSYPALVSQLCLAKCQSILG